jgi:DNA-binding ferritin-like protein (Dps family)
MTNTELKNKLERIDNRTSLDPTDKYYAKRRAFYKHGLNGWNDYDDILAYIHSLFFDFAVKELVGTNEVTHVPHLIHDNDFDFTTNFILENYKSGDDYEYGIYLSRFELSFPDWIGERVVANFIDSLVDYGQDQFDTKYDSGVSWGFLSIEPVKVRVYGGSTITYQINLERDGFKYYDGE